MVYPFENKNATEAIPKCAKSHLMSACHGLMVWGKYLLVTLSEIHIRPPATSYTTRFPISDSRCSRSWRTHSMSLRLES